MIAIMILKDLGTVLFQAILLAIAAVIVVFLFEIIAALISYIKHWIIDIYLIIRLSIAKHRLQKAKKDFRRILEDMIVEPKEI